MKVILNKSKLINTAYKIKHHKMRDSKMKSLTFTFPGKNMKENTIFLKICIFFFSGKQFETHGIHLRSMEDIKGLVEMAFSVKHTNPFCVTIRQHL